MNSVGKRLVRMKAPKDPCLAAGLGVLAVFLLLQLWRPFFFLTDDSLSLFFPVLAECGRKLAAGQAFWISDCLFGGGYNLAADSMFLGLWHPLTLALSLLAPTKAGFAVIDSICLINLLLSATGMVLLLEKLRHHGLADLKGGRAVFVALSYTFSMYVLLLGGSGFWYLFNVAALPWMVLALYTSRGRGVLILALAFFHAGIGGYPSCTLYSGLLLGIITVWKSVHEHSPGPVFRVLAGGSIAALAVVPLMWPSLSGLSESTRGGAIPVDIASEHAMPVTVLLVSAFGSFTAMLAGPFELFGVKGHAYALASSAAAWLAVTACFTRRRMKSWDWLLLGCGALVALLISRPHWLGELIFHIPVLQSLRWPHKEIFLFVFLLHLWIARGSRLHDRWLRLAAIVGTVIFLLPLIQLGPPSLAIPGLNRDLVLSGRAGTYWEKAGGLLKPGERIACVMPDGLTGDVLAYSAAPSVLAGFANYPALYNIKSWSGYSATVPQAIFMREPRAVTVHGVYSESDLPRLLEQPGVVPMLIRANASGEWKITIVRPGIIEPVPTEWIKSAVGRD
jgi:hypothetical protein